MNQKECPECRYVTRLDTAVCPQCSHRFRTQFVHGAPLPPAAPPLAPSYPAPYAPVCIQKAPGTHSVALAILLAVFLMGTGQMFNGQSGKGVLILLVGVFGLLFGIPTGGLLAIPAWVLWVIGIVDAICIANKLNQGRPVLPSEWF